MKESMRLRAGCEMTLVAPSAASVIAMLRPRSGEAQFIVSELYDFEPVVRAVEYVDVFGNLCQRIVVPPGGFRIRTEVVIDVDAAIAVGRGVPATPPEALPSEVLQFLLPSRYCPSDTFYQTATDVVAAAAPGYDQVDAACAWIREHIQYRYGVSDGSTSATDTLRDGAGVCRDFSHVGISMCRALSIPARMVVGYLHRLDPMDLHAWFEAFVDGRWYTFDATQAEAKGGRIAVAYGRDAADVALITQLAPLKTQDMKVWVAEA